LQRRWAKALFSIAPVFLSVGAVINLGFMRTLEQTTQEILELASKHFNVPAGSLAPDDDFFKKLGIDSLQTLEMLSRLENHFGIELPDYEVQGVSDFRTLASRIQSRL
jgi:acyl carrier protein